MWYIRVFSTKLFISFFKLEPILSLIVETLSFSCSINLNKPDSFIAGELQRSSHSHTSSWKDRIVCGVCLNCIIWTHKRLIIIFWWYTFFALFYIIDSTKLRSSAMSPCLKLIIQLMGKLSSFTVHVHLRLGETIVFKNLMCIHNRRHWSRWVKKEKKKKMPLQ